MASPPYFSLIFVNYRSVHNLTEALETLLACETDRGAFEVLIVNHDGREQSALEKLAARFPEIKFLKGKRNRGFGAGANRGARGARGSVLGFLNPDLIWREPLLARLRQKFEQTERLGVAGLNLLTPEGEEEAWSFGPEPSLAGILRNNLWFDWRSRLESAEIAWVSGGALFVRSQLFFQAGGFDERFFLYFEDVDLCRRVRTLNYRIERCAELSVIHKSGRSHESRRDQKKLFYRSQDRYFQKYARPWERLLLRVLRFLRHGTL